MTEQKTFHKTFFRLLALIALQNLIVLGVSLADNMMLGAFSQDALTGAALANQIQFILQMVVMATADGVVLFCSQYWGKKKAATGDGSDELAAMRRVISIGIAVAVGMGLLFFVAVSGWGEAILGLFTDDAAAIAEGVRYLRVIRFSYLCFALTQVCIAALRSVGVVRLGTLLSLMTLVVNVGLNWLLIFGKAGFPRLGTEGAAIATLTARVLELCVAGGYLLRESRIGYRLRQFRLERGLFVRFVTATLPMVLSSGMWGVAMAVQAGILGRMGSSAIAAASIANTIFQLVTVMAGGSASASAVMTAKSVGAGESLAQIKRNTNRFQLLFLGIGLLNGLLLFGLRDVILQFYQLEPDTVAMARQFIAVLSITCIGTAYQMPALTGVVRGGGDTKFVLYNDFIFCWLVTIPMGMAAQWLGLSPVWVFFLLKGDQIWKCFVAVVKVNRYKWIKLLAQ